MLVLVLVCTTTGRNQRNSRRWIKLLACMPAASNVAPLLFVRTRIRPKGRLKLIRLAYTCCAAHMDHRGHTGPAESPAVPVPAPASVRLQPLGTWTLLLSMFRVSQGLSTANVELAAAVFPWPRSASAGTGAKSWPWLKELANVRNSTGPPYLLLGAQPSAERDCLEHAKSGIRLCTLGQLGVYFWQMLDCALLVAEMPVSSGRLSAGRIRAYAI